MNLQKTKQKTDIKTRNIKEVNKVNSYPIKTLNNSAKILIIFAYTLCTTVLTYQFTKKSSYLTVDKKLESIQKNQQSLISNIQQKLQEVGSTTQYAPSLIDIEHRMINAINRKISNISNNDKKLIEEQKQSIYELKQKISNLLNLRSEINVEKPKITTLSYSSQSYDILYYKHQQILKRLKTKNKSKEDAYIALYDMSKTSNQEKLVDLKERLDLEYYSKKRELSGQREKFRTQKFLNIVANK